MSDSRSPCQNSKLVQYKTARVRTGTSQTELLIDLLVRARGTPALETELLEDKVNSGSLHNNDQITHLMTVLLPTEGLGEHKTPSAGEHEAGKKKGPYVESLNGEDGSSTPQDAELVLLRLGIEDGPARQTDNTGLDTLSVEFRSSLQGDADFTTRRDDSEVLVLDIVNNVTTLRGGLDGGVLEVGQVLTGEGKDGRSGCALEGNEVSGRGFVTVSGTPEVNVGGGTEVSSGFDRLVSGTVLAKTDGVVSGDPDNLVLAQCGKTNGASSVRNEVLQMERWSNSQYLCWKWFGE